MSPTAASGSPKAGAAIAPADPELPPPREPVTATSTPPTKPMCSVADLTTRAPSRSARLQVVGCLVEHENKVLLCRRKIEPAYGLWTLPAGYLEVGESAAEGASRETLEEACADVEIVSPFAQLDIPLIVRCNIIPVLFK
ncbi:hypothetical protein ACQ4PT_029103 [Festuca glaucescens]